MENLTGNNDRQKNKSILVVSYGTSYRETRMKTIDVIVDNIQNTYPDYSIYQAWSSVNIIHKLTRDGIIVNSVTDSIEQMINDGMDEIIVFPTHVINGIENELMKENVLKYLNQFRKISFSDPLLTTKADHIKVIHALMQEYRDLPQGEILIFMGHGTAHHGNEAYAALDSAFKELGYEHVFLSTLKSTSSVEDLKKRVKFCRASKIKLVPFMLGAGNHTLNEMSGNQEDSWKNQFIKEGYQVECVMKGLGEYAGIRQIYLEHLEKVILHNKSCHPLQ